MSDVADRIVALSDRPHVRDVIVRRFVSGSWSAIVYSAQGPRAIEGRGATLDEALAAAEAKLEDVAA